MTLSVGHLAGFLHANPRVLSAVDVLHVQVLADRPPVLQGDDVGDLSVGFVVRPLAPA
jgi:hypothetical protein